MSIRTHNVGHRQPLNWRSHAHPIHTDIQPVVSAIRYKKRRIAQDRFDKLCIRLNLMTWEASVVANLIRDTCARKNISFT